MSLFRALAGPRASPFREGHRHEVAWSCLRGGDPAAAPRSSPMVPLARQAAHPASGAPATGGCSRPVGGRVARRLGRLRGTAALHLGQGLWIYLRAPSWGRMLQGLPPISQVLLSRRIKALGQRLRKPPKPAVKLFLENASSKPITGVEFTGGALRKFLNETKVTSVTIEVVQRREGLIVGSDGDGNPLAITSWERRRRFRRTRHGRRRAGQSAGVAGRARPDQGRTGPGWPEGGAVLGASECGFPQLIRGGPAMAVRDGSCAALLLAGHRAVNVRELDPAAGRHHLDVVDRPVLAVELTALDDLHRHAARQV